MSRLPRSVLILARLCLRAPDREPLLGDLEETWSTGRNDAGRHLPADGRKTTSDVAFGPGRRRLWGDFIGLVWTHGRVVGDLRRLVLGLIDGDPAMSLSSTDVRYACRAVARRPALALSLVLTMAGGIALNTVMFSVLSTVLLAPLPYGDPDALVAVWEHHLDRGDDQDELSPANYLDLRARTQTLVGLAAFGGATVNLTGLGQPERLRAQLVTANAWDVLRVQPALGRGFDADAETVGSAPVAIISHRLWVRRFERDPSIVGRTIRLDDRATTIVGVMGPRFVSPGANAEVWLPMTFTDNDRTNRGGHYLAAVGRLAPGASDRAARADLDRILVALEREMSGGERNLRATVNPLHGQLSGPYRRTLILLSGAVAFVLLMACANAANLLIAWAATRRREMAIRLALGASRGRLRGQVLIESLLMAAAAGSLGLGASAWGIAVINRVLPSSARRFAGPDTMLTMSGDAMTIGLDWRVLAFALAATIVTGLLFGTMPARHAAEVSPQDVLRETRTTGGIRARTRKLLVVGQLAVALILLSGGGLLLRSLGRLQAVDPGFDADRVLTLRTVLSSRSYDAPGARRRFYDAVHERVSRLPGVEAAGFVTFLPLTFEGLRGGVAVESRPDLRADPTFGATFRTVTHDYLDAVGVPLLAGRRFSASDTGEQARVVLVNEILARKAWGDDLSKAIGQHVGIFGWRDGPGRWLTVAGVVGAVRQGRLDVAPSLEMYGLQAQGTPFPFAEPRDLAVRVAAGRDPLALASSIVEIVRAVDPEQPVTDVRPLSDIVREGSADRRLYLWLIGAFAVAALGLAAFGLSSVMSYLVAARRHELGLRLALGATSRQVMALVGRECLTLVIIGLLLGGAGALVASRAMRAWLYEIDPADPLTLASVPIVFACCCLVGCAIPVWRSTRIDPITALRGE
jgi:putative ABC transport system permease protein